MKKAKKGIALAILFLAALVVVFFGSSSLAKYQFNFTQQVIGHYVDYRLSHNGEGQSAVIENLEASVAHPKNATGTDVEYTYSYEGFITLSVSNILNDEISQRDIDISLRAPTYEEKVNGVRDAWQNVYPVKDKSVNYEIEIVDALGNIIPSGSDAYTQLTHFEEKEKKTSNIILAIRRLTYAKDEDGFTNSELGELNEIEEFTIILESYAPYKDTQVFNVKVSSKLIMMTYLENEYFGLEQVQLNIKTGRDYTIASSVYSILPVRIDLYLSGDITFDYERFRLSTLNNYQEFNEIPVTYSNGYYLKRIDGKIVQISLFVPAASSLQLNFYLHASSDITITTAASFSLSSGTLYEYTPFVDGVKYVDSSYIIYNK